ncbi:hypothetical protein C0995_013286 [Termitomyces sp. Mi166|nr:hypothetical protein C0995_013286 [Termitomyces sp. Mi166\
MDNTPPLTDVPGGGSIAGGGARRPGVLPPPPESISKQEGSIPRSLTQHKHKPTQPRNCKAHHPHPLVDQALYPLPTAYTSK